MPGVRVRCLVRPRGTVCCVTAVVQPKRRLRGPVVATGGEIVRARVIAAVATARACARRPLARGRIGDACAARSFRRRPCTAQGMPGSAGHQGLGHPLAFVSSTRQPATTHSVDWLRRVLDSSRGCLLDSSKNRRATSTVVPAARGLAVAHGPVGATRTMSPGRASARSCAPADRRARGVPITDLALAERPAPARARPTPDTTRPYAILWLPVLESGRSAPGSLRWADSTKWVSSAIEAIPVRRSSRPTWQM